MDRVGIFAEAAHLESENLPFAFISILSTRGSTPRNVGHMVVRTDGIAAGTIGGGAMERYVVEQAQEALIAGESRVVKRALVETGENAGMHCGGVMEVHIDVIPAFPRLFLIGGGHVNLALAQAADHLGWEIVVAEERPEFASSERFPMASRIHLEEGNLSAAIAREVIDDRTWVVIATADHDIGALRSIIASGAAYIGLLGSKQKVTTMVAQLRSEGVSEEALAALHSPVGLDIGAETPPEIAVSILSEMLQVRSARSGRSLRRFVRDLIVVRGGGDLATGVVWRLHRSGFPVLCLEAGRPTVIRRTVSFAEAVFAGKATIEGVCAVRADDIAAVWEILERGDVPVLVDPAMESVATLKPAVVVDAIIAKKNLGMTRDLAPVTIGLGPGFVAGEDVHAVVETNRGHDLGRVILEGAAQPDTGVPGTIGGESAKRVLRSPSAGVFLPRAAIGDIVEKGTLVATVGDEGEIRAPFRGVVRGLLAEGIVVDPGFKVGDVDPRGEAVNYLQISDKARAVAGGVLEALLSLRSR